MFIKNTYQRWLREVFIVIIVSMAVKATSGETNYIYGWFDSLRTNPDLPISIQLPPAIDQDDNISSSSQYSYVIQVTARTSTSPATTDDTNTNITTSTTNNNGEETFRLVHLATFLPLSNGTHVRPWLANSVASALLAIDDFNRQQYKVFNDSLRQAVTADPSLATVTGEKYCNIRLTTEIFDSEMDASSSVATLMQLRKRNFSLSSPIPSVLIGAYRSATTLPLALLAATHQMAQISPSASSIELDNKELYPLFMRTAPSTVDEAAAAVAYYHEYLNVTDIALLYVTDTFGNAMAQAFQDLCAGRDIRTHAVGFPYYPDQSERSMANVMKSLKKLNLRYTFVIGFDQHYEPVLSAATKEGMIGESFSWMFYVRTVKSNIERYLPSGSMDSFKK